MPITPPTGFEAVKGIHLVQPLKDILYKGEGKHLELVRLDSKTESEAEKKGLKARSFEEINRDVTRLTNHQNDYKVDTHNCETYATAIVYGHGFSKQVDEVVNLIEKSLIVILKTTAALSRSFKKFR
jgi:hypothetical protein